jgi:hypothetical protein
MEYYPAVKRNEVLISWMTLENMVISERNQRPPILSSV